MEVLALLLEMQCSMSSLSLSLIGLSFKMISVNKLSVENLKNRKNSLEASAYSMKKLLPKVQPSKSLSTFLELLLKT